MDEVAKWTRHFRLMAEGKLRKEPGGYYIVNQEPDDQTGGINTVPESNMEENQTMHRYEDGTLKFNRGVKRPNTLHNEPTTRKRVSPPGIPNNENLRKFNI